MARMASSDNPMNISANFVLTLTLMAALLLSPATIAAESPEEVLGASTEVQLAEKAALLALKSAFNNHPLFTVVPATVVAAAFEGDNQGPWQEDIGEGFEEPAIWLPCQPVEWLWIKCDASKRVTDINLNGYDLFLANNSWTGANALSGTMPWGSLTALESLTSLDISNHSISGALDGMQQLSSLVRIQLPLNAFSGSIPDNINTLEKLEELDVSFNQLSGLLPDSLWSIKPLRKLSVAMNQLSGPLPEKAILLSNLTTLFLGYNSFSGPLPESWASMIALEHLYLDGITSPGHIPKTWSALSSLKSFSLCNSTLSGGYPTMLDSAPLLQRLELGGNQLTGRLPGNLFSRWNLSYIDLSNNFFSGEVPEPPEFMLMGGAARFLQIQILPASVGFQNNCLTASPEFAVPSQRTGKECMMMAMQAEASNAASALTEVLGMLNAALAALAVIFFM